jgi:hypothetical protein
MINKFALFVLRKNSPYTEILGSFPSQEKAIDYANSQKDLACWQVKSLAPEAVFVLGSNTMSHNLESSINFAYVG